MCIRDRVESGKADWRQTVDDFYKGFDASLQAAEKNMEGKNLPYRPTLMTMGRPHSCLLYTSPAPATVPGPMYSAGHTGSGLPAGRRLRGRTLPPPPADTMCGALMQYLVTENKNFQPMGANMGILPPLPPDCLLYTSLLHAGL